MAKSKSKKQLLSKVKQGKSDPRNSRLDWGNIKPITKIRENKRKKDLDFGVNIKNTHFISGLA
jgi:hypothetical protein